MSRGQPTSTNRDGLARKLLETTDSDSIHWRIGDHRFDVDVKGVKYLLTMPYTVQGWAQPILLVQEPSEAEHDRGSSGAVAELYQAVLNQLMREVIGKANHD